MIDSTASMEKQLSDAVFSLRWAADDFNNPHYTHTLQLCHLLSDAALGYEHLRDNAKSALKRCTQLFEAIEEDEPLDHPLMIKQIEEILAPFSREIQRAAARSQTLLYPTIQDIITANELLSPVRPKYDSAKLQRCVDAPHALPPESDIAARASRFWNTINFEKPFEQMNSETATLVTQAFLAANGSLRQFSAAEAAITHQEMIRGTSSTVDVIKGLIAPAKTTEIAQRPIRDYIQALYNKFQDAFNTKNNPEAKQELEGETFEQHAKVSDRIAELYYLTTHDVIWINTESSGQVNKYNYVRLEDATYHQYAYGTSVNVFAQAGRFVSALLRAKPFTAGNESTALLSVLSLLIRSGFEVDLAPHKAADWIRSISAGKVSAEQALSEISSYHPGHGVSLRPLVRDLINNYQNAIKALND